MNKTLKTLAVTTAVIGLATVIKRVIERQTQINEIKTAQNGLKSELNLKVDKNQVIEQINMSPELIKIDTTKLKDKPNTSHNS